MKDTHEANLPTEENGKLEETKAPETTPENTAEEVVTNETTDAEVAAEETSEAEVKTDEVAAGEETVATTGKLSKEEILEKLCYDRLAGWLYNNCYPQYICRMCLSCRINSRKLIMISISLVFLDRSLQTIDCIFQK